MSNSVEVLSFDEYYEMTTADMPLPQFPPRTMAQLIALVDQGRAGEISVLEWLDIIENDYHWQGLPENEVLNASRAIWLTICTNDVLGNIAFFKAGLAVEGQPTTMVQPLLSSMSIVRDVPGLNKASLQKIDWILAVKGSDWQFLATQCHLNQQSPMNRVKKLMMPNANRYVDKLPKYLIECAPTSLSSHDQTWLEACFQSLKTAQQRVAFCEQLLERYSTMLQSGVLKSLLEEHCLPNSDYSLWYYLSQNALIKLKTLFDLTSYYELRALVNKLCSDVCSASLDITEQQQKQMRGRTEFWSNYSKQFDRIRVLLPQQSHELLLENGSHLTDQVGVFKSENPLNVEVFIFSLGKLIVVEVLRGELGETRFYKNSKWNAERLFSGSFSSINEIRELAQVEVHDHVLLWQFYCEKLLRTKFKILPNEQTTNFRGMGKTHGQYSAASGLPKPTAGALLDRSRMLEEWLKGFWMHELKTSKYGEQPFKTNQSVEYLVKAEIAKQFDNQEAYRFNLEDASKAGNIEAIHQLGLNMLKDKSVSARKDGERWLAKAASSGHKQALKEVKRYGIEINATSSYLSQALKQSTIIVKHHYHIKPTVTANVLTMLSTEKLNRRRELYDHSVGNLLILLEVLEGRPDEPSKAALKKVTSRIKVIFDYLYVQY
ncbi:EH signature domain-containing protein [Aliivibrio kagoshimensis]|uniref:EH signature domain-containing protein n=1 Tax=Aliivibrio kagoshimensis TaxID=2910230 RepID=UPI003D10EA69